MSGFVETLDSIYAPYRTARGNLLYEHLRKGTILRSRAYALVTGLPIIITPQGHEITLSLDKFREVPTLEMLARAETL